MSEDFDNELISALFDGELTTEQRSQVDAHLAESSAGRNELAQLEAVSALTRSIPSEPAPPELAQRVMSQVAKPETSPPASTPVGSNPSFFARHWKGLAAMATAAAALMVMLRGSSESVMQVADRTMATVSESVSVRDDAIPSAARSSAGMGESADLEAELSSPVGDVQLSAVTEEIFVDRVAMYQVRPGKEELLQRMLSAEMLELKYAPPSQLSQDEGFDVIVVEASREAITNVVANVQKEGGADSLLVLDRNTDADSLGRQLYSAMALGPGESSGGAGFGGAGTTPAPAPEYDAAGGGASPRIAALKPSPDLQSRMRSSVGVAADAKRAKSQPPAAPTAEKREKSKQATPSMQNLADTEGELESGTRARGGGRTARNSRTAPVAKAADGTSAGVVGGTSGAVVVQQKADSADKRTETEASPTVRVIFVVRKSANRKKTKVADPCFDAA